MRGCIGFFMYILFTFWIMIGVLLGVSMIQWALDRDFYTDILTDDALFDALYSAEMPNYFANEVLNADEEAMQSNTALTLALREVIPREYLQGEVTRLVDETFDMLEGQRDTLFLTIDVTEVKDNFRGEEGERFATVLAQNLPDCTPDVENTYGSTALIACIPADISREQAEGLILDVIPTVLQDIPNTVELMDTPVDRGVDGFTFSFGSVVTTVSVTLLCIGALFWIVNSLIGAPNRRTFFLWMGVLLFIPAGLVFSLGMSTRAGVIEPTIESGIADANFGDIEGSEELRTALTETTLNGFDRVSDNFIQIGGGSMALAVVLVILGLASRTGREPYADDPLPVGVPPQEYQSRSKRKNDDGDPFEFDFDGR
jgi:hypothetical protein